MNKGPVKGSSPRRGRAPLAVRVSFEESRVAAACLATAYEQVVPRPRGSVARAARPLAGQDQACSGERTGT